MAPRTAGATNMFAVTLDEAVGHDSLSRARRGGGRFASFARRHHGPDVAVGASWPRVP